MGGVRVKNYKQYIDFYFIYLKLNTIVQWYMEIINTQYMMIDTCIRKKNRIYYKRSTVIR